MLDYKGRKLELDIGTYDTISSLKIPKGWKVEAWEHNIGEGSKWVFTSDTTWVGNANDRISSLVITGN
jgi:hypothetical protein